MKSYKDIVTEVPTSTLKAEMPRAITSPKLQELWATLKSVYNNDAIQKSDMVIGMLPKKISNWDIINAILQIIVDHLNKDMLEENLGNYELIVQSLKTIQKQQQIIQKNNPTEMSIDLLETLATFVLTLSFKKHEK
jgi:hypothetical protein